MRSFAILLSALLLSVSAYAQDLLVKRNGEQMRVKVLKITKKKVQFVRYGTEVPIYSLPVSDISYIEYPMGDRDTFDESGKSNSMPQNTANAPAKEKKLESWHGAVPHDNLAIKDAATNKPETQIYTVGDIYDKDGVKGIVAVVYDGGAHGLVMSLDEACLAWSTLPRKKVKKTGANNKHDGMANMKAIERHIAENNFSWDDFPAFKWCRDKGEGWFLPSVNELWTAGTMYMGGSRAALKRKFRKNYNARIEEEGGTPLSNIMFYHSSTEYEEFRYSYYSHMYAEPPHIDSGFKADDLFVRAFYRF